MKIDDTKLIPTLIVVVPLTLVLSLGFFISSFYINKVTSYFATAKENANRDYIDLQKAQSELITKQLLLLFEYTNNRVEPAIKKELVAKVNLAYDIAVKIHEKYKKVKSKKNIQRIIKDVVTSLTYDDNNNYLFITNYQGDSVLLGSHLKEKNIAFYRDADNRAIVLEEIQKVRRHKEGFLKSKIFESKAEEIVYVKDLEFYDWYIGSSILVKKKQEKLKENLLVMLKSMPVSPENYIGVYEGNTLLYQNKDLNSTDKINNYSFITKEYSPFRWHLVYGFDRTKMSLKAQKKYDTLTRILEKEYDFIVRVSAVIIFFVMLLSLLLSRRVVKLFSDYKEAVKCREEELEYVNNSLEERVQEELKAHREKDKMLAQSTKMAEMGDMISMIAHQWRQPLNQMSYLIMNIESAYEYEELTKEYLDTKVKEANELLEFMSTTIDDFRNYFKPDKEKELVSVEKLIQTAYSLIEKTLQNEDIAFSLEVDTDKELLLYRNEFIQVVLNLIKNSRDALLNIESENREIKVAIFEENNQLFVAFRDNGGGIDENLLEKIFEPYFTTKEKSVGTGLGLYMSKMIIEEHLNATLLVENIENGVEFRVVFTL